MNQGKIHVITEDDPLILDTDKRRRQLANLRNHHHKSCFVCGTLNDGGCRVEFDVCDDGSVEGSAICNKGMQGYAGLVHGGFVATLLDGAMANCLFSYGVAAVTGEMNIKIVSPVKCRGLVHASAWVKDNRSPLYLMSACLRQGEDIVAKASGKFVSKTYIEDET